LAFASALPPPPAPPAPRPARWSAPVGKTPKIEQEECLRFAEVAIQGAGFGRIERTTQSRYGTRGEFTAAIRCVTEYKITFFIMAGPSLKQTPRYLDDVYNHF